MPSKLYQARLGPLLQDDQSNEELEKSRPPDKQRERQRLPMPKSILDCFTGRYIYQVYTVWRKEAARQHELSTDTHCD
jgi:hypothetical protein